MAPDIADGTWYFKAFEFGFSRPLSERRDILLQIPQLLSNIVD